MLLVRNKNKQTILQTKEMWWKYAVILFSKFNGHFHETQGADGELL